MVYYDSIQDGGIDDRTLFGKVWEQTKVTVKLVISYFNWVDQHFYFNITMQDYPKFTDLSNTKPSFQVGN